MHTRNLRRLRTPHDQKGCLEHLPWPHDGGRYECVFEGCNTDGHE